MIPKIAYVPVFLIWIVTLNSCQKREAAPDVSQPLVKLNVDKASMQVGGQTIAVGPEKDYEQGSDVVYQLTVSSSRPLSKLIVKTSSGNVSPLSRVVKSLPENAVDANGNFTQNLKEAVVYYAYHIDTTVMPLSSVTATFTFQNEDKYIGSNTHTFSVIKKGSTNGKPLKVIDMPFSLYNSSGIGTQDNLDLASYIKLTTGELRKNRGPFYSMGARMDIEVSNDAINMADRVDFVGYKTKSAGTNPVLTGGKFYLVSPSDTVILTTTYGGASATPDVQSLIMRNTIRTMASKLAGEGKTLRKVFFKRLDTLTGPNQVTAAYFDMLTHDNEFDTLLAGITADAQTYTGPVGFDQVYGFVMDDGRRGLIRTISPTIQITTDVGGLVPGTIYSIPDPSTGNLLCTIKFQDK
jgi:hypothetical protein